MILHTTVHTTYLYSIHIIHSSTCIYTSTINYHCDNNFPDNINLFNNEKIDMYFYQPQLKVKQQKSAGLLVWG